MTFELLPTIDIMLGLYRKPRNSDRFNEYLKLLQGNTKAGLALPISGFNPMAKDHAVQKLTELKHLDAEKIIEETLYKINKKFQDHSDQGIFKVALNLLDDLEGGWTNRYTSDFDSKFKLNALVTRNFCTPVFWTSEIYTQALVQERTLMYCYRTVYWLANPKPKTLKDHIEQEKFVFKHMEERSGKKRNVDYESIEAFYNKNKDSGDYQLIFIFFYGDIASGSLHLPCYGISGEVKGHEYANILASNLKNERRMDV